MHCAEQTAVVAIRGETITPFQETLRRDTLWPIFALPVKSTQKDVDQFLVQINNVDHIIMGIHNMNGYAKEQYGISDETLDLVRILKQLGKRVTVLLFGSAYSVALVQDADTIIVAYENDPDAQLAAAAVVCGIKKAEGTLPIKIKGVSMEEENNCEATESNQISFFN